jgi:phosphatidylglycerol:prolipoprotein diacylglycerol transferase
VHPVLFHLGPVLIPSYGVMTALGLLVALGLCLRTARIVGVEPAQLWNLSIMALFVALAGSRLLLVVINWSVLRSHPAWFLGLAMIHHPLLAVIAASLALMVAFIYALCAHLSIPDAADALAAPIALGLAFEQFGSLLAGSGFGTETSERWSVVYTSPIAARWSGAPLGVPLHPVQLYAALGFLTLALALLVWLPSRSQRGDIAGLALVSAGVIIFFTELLRDPAGRGSFLQGAFNGPQIGAILLLLAGALLLRERPAARLKPHAASAGAPHE